jgi:hypothetical protein
MKNWSWKKKTGVVLLVLLLVIQFIRPAKNERAAYGENDYTHSLAVTPEIKSIVEKACLDCHSNHTNHQWYENIQPIGWWMNNHISEGKDELNFSEFSSYRAKKKAHKLEETAEMVEEGEMPLSSYTWMHKEAKLSAEEKKMLAVWALSEMKKIEADSLADKTQPK